MKGMINCILHVVYFCKSGYSEKNPFDSIYRDLE